MSGQEQKVVVTPTQPAHFADIERISKAVYPNDAPWTADYLQSHLARFPEGQFVAVESASGRVVGMAASLIIRWEDYDHLDSYNDFTDQGYFRNHDPEGRTLYGAEIMVDPAQRRRGIGSLLYDARESLVRRLGLARIRAGARLPGYYRHASAMSIEAYVREVVYGDLDDPTLSFQLHRGFHVLAIVPNYYSRDPRSRGYAVLIEWLNPDVDASQRGPDPRWLFE